MANAEKKSFVKYITPRGVMVFPKLNKPDEYKGKVTYNTKLRFDLSQPGVSEFVEQVKKLHAEGLDLAKAELQGKAAEEKDVKKKRKIADALAALEAGPSPVRAHVLEDGSDSDSLVEMTFKMPAFKTDKKTNAQVANKLKIVDASGIKPVTAAVWGGSEGKVGGFFLHYYNPATNTAGVSLRMTGVQVLKLVSSGSGGPDFGAEEGYTADDESDFPAAGNDGEAPATGGDEAAAPKSGVQF
jgi:hypothetical protein